MRSTSTRAVILSVSSLMLFLTFGGSFAFAQTQMPTYPTRPSPFIPGNPGPAPTPATPAPSPITIPQTQTLPEMENASGGGFSDYVNGIPTVFTLPDGRRIDISIPENTVAQDSTIIRSQPKVPKAYEQVTLTVENFATKLAEDRITWTVNGRVVKDEIGGDSISAVMGKIGEALSVRVSIESRKTGKRLTKDLILTSGDVAILWEANTYVPPFYKGKPLPSYKSTIKLVPLPTMLVDGRPINPENLLYSWKRNFRNVKEISGYGKRYSVLETGGGIQQERLLLTVSHPDSGASTERNVVIDIVSPKILLYEGSPLQGIRYEKALGKELSLAEQETTVRGEPYFFSNEELVSGTAPLTWKQNGKPIQSLYRTVTLKKPDDTGVSRIEVTLENPTRILQSARSTVSVTYKNQP